MRVLILSGVIVLLDQCTKLLVKGVTVPALGISIQGMQYGASRPILGDLLRLTYIENPGMAFGIDVGGKLFFSVFSVVASAGILVYLHRVRHDSLAFRTSLAMILGGAVGNLIDRVFYGVLFNGDSLFYGKVVDFFDLDFIDINVLGYSLSRWPVFNVADASVTMGVILLLFFHRHSEAKEAKRPVITDPGAGGTLSQPALDQGRVNVTSTKETDPPQLAASE